MMNQCRACSYCIVLNDSEISEFDCIYLSNRAEIDMQKNCNFFEILDEPERYIESFTSCDACDLQGACDLVDVTNMYDEFDHYYKTESTKCYADDIEIYFEEE